MISLALYRPKILKYSKICFLVAAVTLIGELVIGQILIVGINAARPQSPIIGLRYQGQSVSFKSQQQLKVLVKRSIARAETNPVEVRAGNYHGHLNARQLGARYSTSLFTEELLGTGRHGSLWHIIKIQDLALLGTQEQVLGFPKVNSSLSKNYFNFVATKTDRASVNASFVIDKGKLAVVPDIAGISLDQAASLATIEHFNPSKTPVLSLPLQSKKADISVVDLKPLIPRLEHIVSQPISITAADKQILVPPEQILKFMKVTKVAKLTKNPDLSESSKQTAVLSYDDKAIGQVLDQLAAQVAIAPKPKIVNGRSVLNLSLIHI